MNNINLIPMLLAWKQTLRLKIFQVKMESQEWKDLLLEYEENEQLIREQFEKGARS